jgi:hypothetical protein
MSTWLAALRDRPLSERQRRGALPILAVLLALATLVLVLTRPSPEHGMPRQVPARRILASPRSEAAPSPLSAPSAALAGVSRRFLHGYLAYIYGHAPARRIAGAAAPLSRLLRAHRPRVSADERARRPRLVKLQLLSSATAADPRVRALVSDGGVADYPIELVLGRSGDRLLVTGIAP